MDAPISLFVMAAVLFLAIVAILWRYWRSVAEVSSSETAFSRRIARLNDRQSNRLQDTQLTDTTSQDEAWRIMVERGRRQYDTPQYGDTTRRARERQRRQSRHKSE